MVQVDSFCSAAATAVHGSKPADRHDGGFAGLFVQLRVYVAEVVLPGC